MPRDVLGQLTAEELKELKQLQERFDRLASPELLDPKRPTLTPDQYELLALTERNDEIANIAANQSGKTVGAAFYACWVLMGYYPDVVDVCVGTYPLDAPLAWAESSRYRVEIVLEQLGDELNVMKRVFEPRKLRCRTWQGPTLVWWSCWSGDKVRDTAQKLLFGGGRIEERIGSGMIPGDLIVDYEKAPIVRNLLDSVEVKTPYGRPSKLMFKTNAKGSQAYTSEQVHLVVLDELHDEDVIAECRPRTTNTNGVILHTMTEAPGASSAALDDFDGQRPRTVLVKSRLTGMTFYSRAKQDRIAEKYSGAEARARVFGERSQGQGVVFNVPRTKWVKPAVKIMPYWPQGKGYDFGSGGDTGHPSAGVWGALDTDTGHYHIYDEYLSTEQDPEEHCRRMAKPVGIPVFWPHDGDKTDKGFGLQRGLTLAQIYGLIGEPFDLTMFLFSARYVDDVGGAQSSAAFVAQLKRLMDEERLWVHEHLYQTIKCLEDLHYKDGKINDYKDDLFSALKYLMIMERHWVVPEDANASAMQMVRYR